MRKVLAKSKNAPLSLTINNKDMSAGKIHQEGCAEWWGGGRIPNPRGYQILKREQKKLFMKETEK